MKTKEYREFSEEQLILKINEESQTLTRLRFAHAVSSVENPMKIKHMRKNIARLKTELRSRELSAEVNKQEVIK